jgi:hypothetical protein
MALNTEVYGARDAGLSNTIVGIFATTHDAREAIKHLHKGNFKQTWLGVTKPPDGATGEPLVEDPNSLSRFFAADRLPLHRALLQHGVSEEQAEEIEANIAPGCAVLTVYGEDNPQRVSELLRENKGHVVDAGGAFPEAVAIAGQNPRTGVDRDERKANENEARFDRAEETRYAGTADPDEFYEETEFIEARPRIGI